MPPKQQHGNLTFSQKARKLVTYPAPSRARKHRQSTKLPQHAVFLFRTTTRPPQRIVSHRIAGIASPSRWPRQGGEPDARFPLSSIARFHSYRYIRTVYTSAQAAAAAAVDVLYCTLLYSVRAHRIVGSSWHAREQRGQPSRTVHGALTG